MIGQHGIEPAVRVLFEGEYRPENDDFAAKIWLAYAERRRQKKIQMYEDRLAKGGFLPYVAVVAVAPTSRRRPRPSAISSARAIGPYQSPRHRPHRDRTGTDAQAALKTS